VRAAFLTHVVVLDRVILTGMGERIPTVEFSLDAFFVSYVFNQRLFEV
jgi:hypothetical protein